MASCPPGKPLVLILGATGTGKSKMAVDLATRFNGEIINGDAMQMYKGLPIITNKIGECEREGIPHHLLGCIGLNETTWTVREFVNESQRIIQGIHERGKLPILVGGTHYYTQAVLFEESTLSKDDGESMNKGEGSHKIQEFSILDAPTPEIYAKLQEVDPVMAARWHPKDRRKIRRSLEVWLRTGQQASKLYEAQKQRRATEQGNSTEANQANSEHEHTQNSLFRPESLLLWLDAQDDVLKARLNARVDSMMANGLLEEAQSLADFAAEKESKDGPIDKTVGIWASIGFKEIEPYLVAAKNGDISPDALNDIKLECIEAIKAGTRRYAGRQRRWIRRALAHALIEAGVFERLFVLDGTNLGHWSESVDALSCSVVESFITGQPLPNPQDLSSFARQTLSTIEDSERQIISATKCDVCEKVLMTDVEFQSHLRSRGHRKLVQSQQKRLKNGFHRSSREDLPAGSAPG